MKVWVVSAEGDDRQIYRPGRCVFTACLKLGLFPAHHDPKESQVKSIPVTPVRNTDTEVTFGSPCARPHSLHWR